MTDGGNTIELILTKTGARYRVATDATSAADELNFSAADNQFDQFGPLAGAAVGDGVVVYNLGISGADAYAGDNRSQITGTPAGALAGEQRISITSKQFPFESPGNRFQVVSGPVSYVCDTVTGRLVRYSGYGYFQTQRTAAQLAGLVATPPLLADGVSNCTFTYASGVTERAGLATLILDITRSGETVRLYHEVHVNNVP